MCHASLQGRHLALPGHWGCPGQQLLVAMRTIWRCADGRWVPFPSPGLLGSSLNYFQRSHCKVASTNAAMARVYLFWGAWISLQVNPITNHGLWSEDSSELCLCLFVFHKQCFIDQLQQITFNWQFTKTEAVSGACTNSVGCFLVLRGNKKFVQE